MALLESYFDFVWRTASFAFSRVYLAFAYLVGLFIPGVRHAIKAYEEDGDGKSIRVLAGVAAVLFGIPMGYGVVFLDYPKPPWTLGRFFLVAANVALTFIGGVVFLTLEHDARKKAASRR